MRNVRIVRGTLDPKDPYLLGIIPLGFGVLESRWRAEDILSPLLEVFGAVHDASQFEGFIGNNQLLATYLAVSWTTAGFGEELIWRGFVMTRIAKLFGDSRSARVTAVIVTYESASTIEGTLRSIGRCRESAAVECVVVDSASKDETLGIVSRIAPWARIIRNKSNRGFATGCNDGFRVTDTPYVLFLNPDAEIEPMSVRALVSFLEENPRAAISAPSISTPSGEPHPAGKALTPRLIMKSALGFRSARNDMSRIEPGASPFRIEWASGAVFLVRSQAFENVGGFDERFFLYFEETDLCRRLSVQGWELWGVGAAVASHQVAASAKKSESRMFRHVILTHFFRSRYYYLVKHHGWIAASMAELVDFIASAGRLLVYSLVKRRDRDLLNRLRAPLFRFPDKPVGNLHEVSRPNSTGHGSQIPHA